MKYFIKRRFRSDNKSIHGNTASDEDPMSGVLNLFDISVVFIVGLILTIFNAYHLQELFDQKSEMTIMKQSSTGEMEIITKKGTKVKSMKVSKSKASGQGERLGIAYKLEDGTMVYVPEE